MDDLEFIKSFSKISITNVCKKLKIDRSNLINGKTTKENIKKVRRELEREYAKLYLKGENEYVDNENRKK